MKSERQLTILSILLQKESITVSELSKKLEVSKRTIQRDIDTLAQAGIPIVSKQGLGGGISIVEGFKLDKTLLTDSEMAAILSGLRSLDSISNNSSNRHLMEKLSEGSSNVLTLNEYMLIDLSSWAHDEITSKLSTFKDAIKSRRLVTFRYISPTSDELRRVEPYYLVFHWSNWYVWAYSIERSAMRLFKLNRIDDIKVLDECYIDRKPAEPVFAEQEYFNPSLDVSVIFDSSVRWRVYESFGRENLTTLPDNRVLFKGKFADEDYFLTFLLSFRDKAEILKPEYLRERICKFCDEIRCVYEKMV